MVELIICLIVLPLFVTGIVRFGQTLIIQQRLLMAAKHGVILRSTNLVSDTEVRSEIRRFLSNTRSRPRMEGNRITIRLSRVSGPFGNPISRVEVGYRIRVPKFSNNFFQPFKTEQITLRESAFCANFRRLSGTPYTPDF
ncbi:MAG: hypothetical protein ABIJ15_03490 [bacterium]